jgi:hypothetical protein
VEVDAVTKGKKWVFILARLVEEAGKVSGEEIEREILEELSPHHIPWVQRIEKVTVSEEKAR